MLLRRLFTKHKITSPISNSGQQKGVYKGFENKGEPDGDHWTDISHQNNQPEARRAWGDDCKKVVGMMLLGWFLRLWQDKAQPQYMGD